MPQIPQPAIAADLLRNARWMVGLTQAEVAQRAGLTRQVISSYESGSRCPSVGTLERLDFPFQDALVAIAEAVPDQRLVIVTSQAAARLRGACVRVLELDLWFAPGQPDDDIRAWLAAAGMVEPFPITSADLRDGVRLAHGLDQATDVVVRRTAQFAGYLSRSTSLDLLRLDAPQPVRINIAGPDDSCLGWHPRDRDHLALQRAVRLAEEHAAGG